jgi:8-oxo-dGTP pyrophosphatase MutT (NUDIX family)
MQTAAVTDNSISLQDSGVAVILYSLDAEGLLEKIGVVTEKNDKFPGGVYRSIVTGAIEEDDESLLQRAVAEVFEETGYQVDETARWKFLGEMYTSKFFSNPLYCYSLDVTSSRNTPPKGDGSESERGIEFEMLSLDQVKRIPDALLQAMFMKLFVELYKNYLT